MIAIFDYGSGNLRSAQRAFEKSGADVVVTSDVSVAKKAKGLVIPGVGAFSACYEQLVKADGVLLIKERVASGDPIIGICVGMQVLFAASNEKGIHKGVGVFQGDISALDAAVLPQIGWNTVEADVGSTLFKGVAGEHFYFVHSYAAKSAEVGAKNTYATYGEKFLAAVERENVSATQFHPEKSGSAGLQLIKNWVDAL